MKIREEILKILDSCVIKGNTVFLPQIQLERKVYLEVNKHLENLGGKWDRKTKGHVFESDPTDSFENMLSTGETTDFKKEFQFFETPPDLAKKMIEMAELKETDMVLEPSAGLGAIVKHIENGRLFFNDINQNFVDSLAYDLMVAGKDIFSQSCQNFLKTNDKFDKIIMNPPFTKQQDINHILHAYSLLNPGGILVSIVSESPFFRENKKSVAFREFLAENSAEIIKNPEGTFKASGTMVSTRIIKIDKETTHEPRQTS